MADGYIGQVSIGSNNYLIGSTLYGTCDTPDITESDGNNVKQVKLWGNAPFNVTDGITIHVKFTHKNTETDNTLLKIQFLISGNSYTTERSIVNPNGSITWNAGSIISFTYDSDEQNYVINSSSIGGSSFQNLSLGNITNEGKISDHPSSLVVTNSEAQIIGGAPFGRNPGTYLGNNGSWTSLPDGSTTSKGIVQLSGNSSEESFAATAKSVYDLNTTVDNLSNTVTGLLASEDALVYKGILPGVASNNSGGTYTPAANKGDVYKVSSAGYINGIYVEAGDMFICNTDNTEAATEDNYNTIQQQNWDIIQTNLTNAVISDNGISGYLVKFSGANTIENGPQIRNGGTGFLKEDGTWGVPTLSQATDTNLGGIKIGYTESGTNYAVKLNNDQAYVTVPWTDSKVEQLPYTVTNSNKNEVFNILFKHSSDNTEETNSVYYSDTSDDNKLTFTPSTGTLSAKCFNGKLAGTDSSINTLTFYHKSGEWKTLNPTIASVTDGTLTITNVALLAT